MKFHFGVLTAFERLSGICDESSRSAVLRRSLNRLCAVGHIAGIAGHISRAALRYLNETASSLACLFRFGVKEFDALGGAL